MDIKTKNFFTKIYGNKKGWLFLAYSNQGKFAQKTFIYPNQLNAFLADMRHYNSWANVWFCIHLCKDTVRTKPNAMPIKALWIDYDRSDVERIQPKPSICWQTSEDRYQAVWLLDSFIEPTRAEKVNRQLTYANKGDKGKWALTTLLRFPHSLNYKYNPKQQGFVMWDDGPVYSIGDLEAPILNIPDDLFKEVTTIPKTIVNKSGPQILQQYGNKIPTIVWNLLNKKPAASSDWSENLWRLQRLLLESGMSVEDTFVVCRDSNWNKYRRDGRPDLGLWQEINKATAKQITIKNTSQNKEGLTWVNFPQLLDNYEKPEWLVQDMWMQKNVGFIAGIGKSYKSVLSIDLALSIASGEPFLGKYEIKDPGPVLMVQEEDPLWRLSQRCRVIAEQKKLTPLTLDITENEIVLVSNQDKKVPLITSISSGFTFSDPKKVAALEEAIDQYRPRMLILDPFFMMTSGLDLYKANDVTPILSTLKDWRNKYSCAIAVIHHYRNSTGSFSERLYGSMAFYAWSENSWFVERAKDNNIVTFTRDIKDALTEKDIAIEFSDISETYKFTVYEKEAEVFTATKTDLTPANKRIEKYLRTVGVNRTTTVKEISMALDISTKTVLKELKLLDYHQKVTLKKHGTGSKIIVTVCAKLIKNMDVKEVKFEI